MKNISVITKSHMLVIVTREFRQKFAPVFINVKQAFKKNKNYIHTELVYSNVGP